MSEMELVSADLKGCVVGELVVGVFRGRDASGWLHYTNQ